MLRAMNFHKENPLFVRLLRKKLMGWLKKMQEFVILHVL